MKSVLLLPAHITLFFFLSFTVVTTDTSKNATIVHCLPHEWACADNQCIDELRVCDTSADCSNGEDEDQIMCRGRSCPNNNYIRCDNHYCVPISAACDYIDNCKDGTDERNCSKIF